MGQKTMHRFPPAIVVIRAALRQSVVTNVHASSSDHHRAEALIGFAVSGGRRVTLAAVEVARHRSQRIVGDPGNVGVDDRLHRLAFSRTWVDATVPTPSKPLRSDRCGFVTIPI